MDDWQLEENTDRWQLEESTDVWILEENGAGTADPMPYTYSADVGGYYPVEG